MVDIESDGPIPGDYSMIEIGAVLCGDPSKTFYGNLAPISEKYIPEALRVTGRTREQTLAFSEPGEVMLGFSTWLKQVVPVGEKVMFISDNNGFDFMFVCWYFWHFLKECPFGHSSTNLGSLYKGMIRDTFMNFKHLKKDQARSQSRPGCDGQCRSSPSHEG